MGFGLQIWWNRSHFSRPPTLCQRCLPSMPFSSHSHHSAFALKEPCPRKLHCLAVDDQTSQQVMQDEDRRETCNTCCDYDYGMLHLQLHILGPHTFCIGSQPPPVGRVPLRRTGTRLRDYGQRSKKPTETGAPHHFSNCDDSCCRPFKTSLSSVDGVIAEGSYNVGTGLR